MMGLEVSGEIVAVGETTRQNSSWKPGDKVCALLGGGGSHSRGFRHGVFESVSRGKHSGGRYVVDVAIDCLGGEMMGKCLRYLRHGARWIMIAALAGTKTEVDLKNIYVRNVRIVGSTLRSRTPEVKAKILAGIV